MAKKNHIVICSIYLGTQQNLQTPPNSAKQPKNLFFYSRGFYLHWLILAAHGQCPESNFP